MPISVLVAAVLALRVQSQAAPRMISLDKPERVLAADFSQIRGVRELRDGRVLLADRLDKGVVVADFATNVVKPVGRIGSGPQEYRLPTALIALPGDSTMLMDEGNSRVAIIGPDLRIARSFTLLVPGVPLPMGSRGVDDRGRHFLQIPGWVRQGTGVDVNDSVPIVRFDPASQRIDTIVRVKGVTWRPPGPSLGIPYVIYAAQDVWAITSAGRLAVVRGSDYHVEWFGAQGRVARGPAVPHEALPITMDDRIAYVRKFLENSNIGGRGVNGGTGMSATPASMLEEREVRALAERNLFAAAKPPFTDALPLISPEGTLWVERTGRLGDAPRWDVFDAAGALTARVRLQRDRRVIGLGVGTVYVVAVDDDGLQHLERHRRVGM